MFRHQISQFSVHGGPAAEGQLALQTLFENRDAHLLQYGGLALQHDPVQIRERGTSAIDTA